MVFQRGTESSPHPDDDRPTEPSKG
uniref:Uncharacterized protein n=1 Tax=Oryza meridionalis TaxID=40149 RepID=A0A0E0BWI4_9ORYZ